MVDDIPAEIDILAELALAVGIVVSSVASEVAPEFVFDILFGIFDVEGLHIRQLALVVDIDTVLLLLFDLLARIEVDEKALGVLEVLLGRFVRETSVFQLGLVGGLVDVLQLDGNLFRLRCKREI